MKQQLVSIAVNPKKAKAMIVIIVIISCFEQFSGFTEVLQARQPVLPKFMRKKSTKRKKTNGFCLALLENLLVWQQLYRNWKIRFILVLHNSHQIPYFSNYSCYFFVFWLYCLSIHFLKQLSCTNFTEPEHLQGATSWFQGVQPLSRQILHYLLAQFSWIVVEISKDQFISFLVSLDFVLRCGKALTRDDYCESEMSYIIFIM